MKLMRCISALVFLGLLGNLHSESREASELDEAEVTRMGRQLAEMETTPLERGRLFEKLAAAWLRIHLPEWLEHPVLFPEKKEEIRFPEAFPKEWRQAVQRYRMVVAVRDESQTKQEGISYQEHSKAFWELLGQLLAEGGGPFFEKVSSYRWGFWCGTGSNVFVVPQEEAKLVAAVRDGLWAQAGAASLKAGDLQGQSVRVLKCVCDDPVDVVMGGILWHGIRSKNEWSEDSLEQLLGLLLGLEGDERMERLMQAVRWTKTKDLPMIYEALGRVLPRVKRENETRIFFSTWGFGGWRNLLSAAVVPVSEREQKRILEFLNEQASSEIGLEAGKTLVRILGDKGNAVSVTALQKLVAHPSLSLAKNAVETLQRSFGVKVDLPPKQGPVQLRLMFEGRPVENRKVEWRVEYPESSVSSEVMSDAEGIMEIPRDYFLDRSQGEVKDVTLSSVEMTGPEELGFRVRLESPAENDELVEVELEGKPIRVMLDFPGEVESGQRMELVLNGPTMQESWSPPKTMRVPLAKEVNFAALTPGEYALQLRVPGATREFVKLQVGKEPEMRVKFQQASDLLVQMILPEGWQAVWVRPVLLPEERAVFANWEEDENHAGWCFSGVRPGKYELSFPSSAEVRKRRFKGGPDAAEFESKRVAVEVKEDSPAMLEVRVDMVAKDK